MADVLGDLRAAVGGDASEATRADTVAGMPARWVVRPGTTAHTSAVMRAAAAHGLTVVPRGAGTKLAWGAAPEKVDVLLDTTRMDAWSSTPPVTSSASWEPVARWRPWRRTSPGQASGWASTLRVAARSAVPWPRQPPGPLGSTTAPCATWSSA